MTYEAEPYTRAPQGALTDELRRCIEACFACATECGSCGTADILAAHPALAACARSCVDCQDICLLVASLMSRFSPLAGPAAVLCIDACSYCARECEAHDHEHCRRCAAACRACERELRAMRGAADRH